MNMSQSKQDLINNYIERKTKYILVRVIELQNPPKQEQVGF